MTARALAVWRWLVPIPGGDELWEPPVTGGRMVKALAVGGMVAYMGLGVGGLLSAIGGAGPVPPSVATSPPPAPTLTVTAFGANGDSLWVQTSAYAGDGSLDSIQFQVDTVGGGFSSPQYLDANGGTVVRDTAVVDSGAVVISRARHFDEYGAGEWSATDTTTVEVAGVSPDMYKPSGWNDTIHFTTWEGGGAPLSLVTNPNQSSATPIGWLNWGTNCLGGIASGWANTTCNGLDSVQVGTAGTQQDPWVIEDYIEANTASDLEYYLTFANGNGSGATSSVTRLYFRFSLYNDPNYDYGTSSNKLFNINGIDDDFLQLWDAGHPVWTNQSSPATANCSYGLTANTWEDYYPGDTVTYISPTDPTCVGEMGIGGLNEPGIWYHLWACVDFSPAAGSRVLSYGVVSELHQGIAAYHNNVTSYEKTAGPITSFESLEWNGTYGGAKSSQDNYRYHDELLVMTGSSGSCVVPPSFQ